MSTGENRGKKSRIRENKTKSGQSRNGRSIPAYALGTLGLVILVTAAFFGPEIVFAVQDDIRCGRVVSMSPIEVDVTSFNTGYEKDLYKRLERFAKGLAEGRQYYATFQDMELTSEIADWMVSEQGYYRESFQTLVWNLGLIPEQIFDYNLISWKRCVIYGDDFAGGVNFILWYIELGNNDRPAVRLLVDGETGDIYGIRTNFDALFQDGAAVGTDTDTLVDLYNISDSYNDVMWELSIIIGRICGGLEISDMLNWLMYTGSDYYPMNGTIYIEIPADYEYIMQENEQAAVNAGKQPDYDWINKYSVEQIQDFMNKLQWRISEGGNCLDFDFPYGDSILNFRVRLDGKIRWFKSWDTRCMDITLGFPEIYEKIPAFTEDWN